MGAASQPIVESASIDSSVRKGENLEYGGCIRGLWQDDMEMSSDLGGASFDLFGDLSVFSPADDLLTFRQCKSALEKTTQELIL